MSASGAGSRGVALLGALLMAALPALGCLAPPVPVADREEFEAIRASVGRPALGRLTVQIRAPEALAPAPSGPEVRAAGVTPDYRSLGSELVRALGRLEAFEAVDSADEGDMAAHRLEITPRRSDVQWTGMHGSWPLSLFIWSLTGPPGWFIPDEAYEAHTVWDVRFVPAGAGASHTTAIDRVFAATLNDFDRGWSFWDLLCYYGTPIDDAVLQRVGGLLLAHANADATLGLCDWLAREVLPGLERVAPPADAGPEPEPVQPDAVDPAPVEPTPAQPDAVEPTPVQPEVANPPDDDPPNVAPPAVDPPDVDPPAAAAPALTARTRVLCVGVNAYAADWPCMFADADATALGGALRGALALDARDVTVLLDAAATRDAIRAWVDRLAADGFGARDRVWICFAGRGSTDASGEPYLLPVESEGQTPESTGVRLRDLGRALQGIGSVTLVLDCAFQGRKEERGPSLDRRALGASTVLPPTTRVLAAAWGAGEATTSGGLGHGLLTAFVLQTLAGKGDADGDGVVTLAETLAHVQPQVARAARRRGVHQQPTLASGNAAAPLIETLK